MNTDSELLGLLYSDAKIFIPGDKHRITDRSVPRQRDHVRDNQRIDALLFSDAIHEAEANLDVLWRFAASR